MEKTSIRIDNLFFAIVESNNYKAIENRDEYTNRMQPQKEILKTVLIPKVKQVITELSSSNDNFSCIKIEKVISKYTSSEKSLKIELVYDDNRENVHYIYKTFGDFKRELWTKLLQYNLYVA